MLNNSASYQIVNIKAFPKDLMLLMEVKVLWFHLKGLKMDACCERAVKVSS